MQYFPFSFWKIYNHIFLLQAYKKFSIPTEADISDLRRNDSSEINKCYFRTSANNYVAFDTVTGFNKAKVSHIFVSQLIPICFFLIILFWFQGEHYSYPALHFVTSRQLSETEAKKKENQGKKFDFFTIKFFPRELPAIVQALEQIQAKNDHLPW